MRVIVMIAAVTVVMMVTLMIMRLYCQSLWKQYMVKSVVYLEEMRLRKNIT